MTSLKWLSINHIISKINETKISLNLKANCNDLLSQSDLKKHIEIGITSNI